MPKAATPVDEIDTIDFSTKGIYHFLDVGSKPYGDCILVEFGEIKILIDGSHVSDFDGGDGQMPIPDQIAAVLQMRPPFDIDLLVVTHCHADHVGCLPELVAKDIIRPRFALITDQKLGFGRVNDNDATLDLSDDEIQATLAAAMREEDMSFLSDADLEDFLDVAKSVESRYKAFVADLNSRGTTVIEFKGQKLPAALTTLMKPTGMKVLGPSAKLLNACAEQIGKTNKESTDAIIDWRSADSSATRAELYRSVADTIDASGGRGAAMNCQSISLAFGPPGERALLAGDMQFADPGVTGGDAEIAALRSAVIEHGPYTLFKTTHHTAHNGQDDALLTALGNPPLIVHTGGADDKHHPNAKAISVLRKRSESIRFGRTDRNRIISVQPHLGSAPEAMRWIDGALNDFSLNRISDQPSPPVAPPPPPPAAVMTSPEPKFVEAPRATAQRSTPQVIIVNLPEGPVSMIVDGVAISVSAPQAQVTGNDFGPGPTPEPAPGSIALPTGPLANGRQLPPLLFVTNRERLMRNIGSREASAALSMIDQAGQRLISVSPDTANKDVRATLAADPTLKGVVIVGGYDVVPSYPTDVLDAQLRRTLGGVAEGDPDQFIVWSDDEYGDINGDLFADLPVSRIPDARDAALVFAALQADAPSIRDRFGIRNIERPFADKIWQSIDGARALNVSEAFIAQHVNAIELHNSANYIMLHGSHRDGQTFTGEYADGRADEVIALEARNIPSPLSGLVFAGCCWGALVVSERAFTMREGTPSPRVPERSIALSYLKAGASAFVGCTGAHYSGTKLTRDANPALMLHEAFWAQAKAHGYAAAPALFAAKANFFDFIEAQAETADPRRIAQMLKNRAQFTCLGLGW